MSKLETVNDGNWKDFAASELSVLVVTEDTCSICKEWKAELSEYLENNRENHDCRFGAVVLDGEGVEEFKKANEAWLDQVDGVPFTVLYYNGEPKTSFYGGGIQRLLNRLKRIDEHTP
jgi:hypothetical protein